MSTPRYGMVVDLNRCVGCQTCTIACKHQNDTTPGVQWRRVLDVETGAYPDVERLFLVTGCQHCADPPCVPVCPTGATFQREDGLVGMEYDTCIGCGYCAVACPYQARTIVHDQRFYYGEQTRQERAVAHPERFGVAQKCTFCQEKVDDGKAHGLVPGVDAEATPACASACIASAIHFGDFADPDSNVARLARENASFQMHAGLGTDPQIRYLYETPAVPGREPSSPASGTGGSSATPGGDDERLADPANPLVGARQTLWDVRAATNFTLGGMSAGLAVAACAATVIGAVGSWALVKVYAAAALLMALGLFAVFLEIGRKRRFLYSLRRPSSSWMTREVYFVAVFYPAVVLDLISPHLVLHYVAAVAALGFLYSQARILHAGKGIPAWRVRLMPTMLVLSGLHEGVGVLAIAIALFAEEPVHAAIPAVGMVLALLGAALWNAYAGNARANGIPPLARREIERITPWLLIGGYALPFALYGAALASPGGGNGAAGLAGGLAFAGGALWKITVITRAAYQQGFAIERYPQRGSGRCAAPRRMEPPALH